MATRKYRRKKTQTGQKQKQKQMQKVVVNINTSSRSGGRKRSAPQSRGRSQITPPVVVSTTLAPTTMLPAQSFYSPQQESANRLGSITDEFNQLMKAELQKYYEKTAEKELMEKPQPRSYYKREHNPFVSQRDTSEDDFNAPIRTTRRAYIGRPPKRYESMDYIPPAKFPSIDEEEPEPLKSVIKEEPPKTPFRPRNIDDSLTQTMESGGNKLAAELRQPPASVASTITMSPTAVGGGSVPKPAPDLKKYYIRKEVLQTYLKNEGIAFDPKAKREELQVLYRQHKAQKK